MIKTDYKLKYKDGLKILFLCDPQLMDSDQRRFPERINAQTIANTAPNMVEHNCFNILDDVVSRTQPDLIAIAGDNVYGEFDDNCSMLKLLINKIDSYKIPFTLVFGNHDNECKLGRRYQTEIIKKSKYALFNETDFSIGFYDENDELKRILLCIDTNACYHASEQSLLDGVIKIPEFGQTQLEYMKQFVSSPSPIMIMQHIIPMEAYKRLITLGKFEENNFKPFDGDITKGEFGSVHENPCFNSTPIMELYKQMNVDNLLIGHDHVNNLSFLYDEMRITYINKSSRYDYHEETMLGGTLGVLSDDGKKLSLEHIFTKR